MAEKIKEYNPTHLCCVVRGGMSSTHVIARHLKKEVVCFDPKTETNFARFLTNEDARLVFIEDLVAKGRTFDIIKSHMKLCSNELSMVKKELDWKICPVLVDHDYMINSTDDFKDKLLTYGMITKHWIVMPYEDLNATVEGDHGLFRDRSDQYGK